jgi:hypothetical protein
VHGVLSQKAVLFITTDVGTSNPTIIRNAFVVAFVMKTAGKLQHLTLTWKKKRVKVKNEIQLQYPSKIGGFYDGDYEEWHLLEFYTMWLLSP